MTKRRFRSDPVTPAVELQEAGERLLDEVVIVVDGGHANVRGTASPEAIRAAEAAVARYEAEVSDEPNADAEELAGAIRSLLPIVHEHSHPDWDDHADRLLLAVYHHSWAVERER